jgi:hypothetical protein
MTKLFIAALTALALVGGVATVTSIEIALALIGGVVAVTSIETTPAVACVTSAC